MMSVCLDLSPVNAFFHCTECYSLFTKYYAIVYVTVVYRTRGKQHVRGDIGQSYDKMIYTVMIMIMMILLIVRYDTIEEF